MYLRTLTRNLNLIKQSNQTHFANNFMLTCATSFGGVDSLQEQDDNLLGISDDLMQVPRMQMQQQNLKKKISED